MKKATVILVIIFSLLACRKFLPSAPADDQVLDGPLEELQPESAASFLAAILHSMMRCSHPRPASGHCLLLLPADHAMRVMEKDILSLRSRDSAKQILPVTNTCSWAGHNYNIAPSRVLSPSYCLQELAFPSFTPPANTGLGFIDIVPDAAILAMADENDADGDGISGRPNWVHIPAYLGQRTNVIELNGKYIGRFGKKGAVYDLLQQTANAYNQDMGISSSYEYRRHL